MRFTGRINVVKIKDYFLNVKNSVLTKMGYDITEIMCN